MTAYFVATTTRYVLVDAENEPAARIVGQAALHELYVDLRERLGRDVPIEMRAVRPATADEIELWRWHAEMVSRESAIGPNLT